MTVAEQNQSEQNAYEQNIHTKGIGGVEEMKTLLTMELRSREALREAQKATREIWVTP